MAYSRRTFHGRRTYRKRRSNRGRRYVSPRYIRSVVYKMSENHQSTGRLSNDFASVGASWIEIDMLAGIQEGTDIFNRVGRKISVTSLEIKGVLMGGAVGGGTLDDLYNNLRLLIYTGCQVKSGSAITPLLTANFPISQPLRKYTYPFLSHVYRNMFIGITNSPVDADTAAPGHRKINIFIKFRKPLVCNFSGSGTNVNQTQLWVSMISDSATIPNPGFTVGYYSLNWKDI